MDYKDILNIVRNVAESDEGFKFIQILLEQFGAFDRSYNFENVQREYFNKGKKEQGLWLLDLLKESHFNRFCEVQKISIKEKE